jgi:hypothetical protein
MTMDQAVTNGSNAGYDYPANRTMGQAIKDTRESEHHQHHNGVNGTNGRTVNGTTAPHF